MERLLSSENSTKGTPDKVAADRGEALDEALGLEIAKNATIEAFTGRARLLFARFQKEGVNLPTLARRYWILRGCGLGNFGRAAVISATRSWDLDKVCTAIRTAFPGYPADR